MTWITTTYIGIALILFATVMAFREHAWIKSANIANGKVVELIRMSGGNSVSYKPRVQYRAADGSTREFTRSYGSSPVGFYVGQQITVAYDTSTYEGRILTFGQRFGFATIIFVLGICLLMMATAFRMGNTYIPSIYKQKTDATRSW